VRAEKLPPDTFHVLALAGYGGMIFWNLAAWVPPPIPTLLGVGITPPRGNRCARASFGLRGGLLAPVPLAGRIGVIAKPTPAA